MNPLLQQFLVEGRDLIQEATEGLLVLERDPADKERLAAVFRAFHTLKGSSGLFDLAPMTSMLHAAEDVLAALRAGGTAIDADLIDVLLDCLDQTGGWLGDLESGGALRSDARARASDLVARLHGRSGPEDDPAEPRAAGGGNAKAAGGGAADEALRAFDEKDLMAALGRFLDAGSRAGIFAIDYIPDPRCFFNGDDPLRLMRELEGLAALKLAEREPWPPAAALDPFTCSLDFHALSVGAGDAVRDAFRFVSDQAAITALEPETLIRVEGDPLYDPRMQSLASEFADGVGGKAKALAEACAGLLKEVPEGCAPASALRWLLWLLGRPDAPGGWLAKVLASLAQPPDPAGRVRSDMMRALILEQRHLLAGDGCPKEEFAGRVGAAATTVINVLIFEGRVDEAREIEAAHARAVSDGTPAPLAAAIDRLSAVPPEAPGPQEEPDAAESSADEAAGRQAASRVLRVDEARIDRLMGLVGEMMAARNRLSWLTERVEELPGAQEQVRHMRELQGVLAHLTREMHGSIVQIRMLPVGRVFQRFPRLVRDLSRRLGKPVEILIRGEDTEADKTLVEALFEPLLHLVRNSLDHGVETVEERRAAGKPVPATLGLRAFREGDRIAIEVSDDGRGMDAGVIRRKAVETGLLTAGEAEGVSEEEALRFIFAPGFSTTQSVSDLSGRGIGMYAVRAAVEKAGGSVSVSSVKGEGTTILLRLPPTVAVMQVLTVAVGEHRFGVPVDAVLETVHLPRGRISRIRQRDAFVLRERVVPLRHLGDLLDMGGPRAGDAADARILVVDVDGHVVGLEVDRFGEPLSVVLNPMEGFLASISGYLGTTVLGDGQVLLVLDLKEILR
jgi:two-component system, chemotaxis family, sensor kinase CheA